MKRTSTIILHPKSQEHTPVVLPGVVNYQYVYDAQQLEVLIVHYLSGQVERYPTLTYKIVQVIY